MSVRQWASLCASAGFDIRSMGGFEVYELAGKIVRDEPLRVAWLAGGGSREQVLVSWPESERAALRARILGSLELEKVRRGGRFVETR